MLRYTFIEHPLSYLSDNLKNYIPGVTEAYAAYCNPDKEVVLKCFAENGTSKLSVKNKVHLLQKTRKYKAAHAWFRKDMLLFLNEVSVTGVKSKKKIQQLTLEDEDDNNYLCLKFISPFDRMFDMLIIKVPHAGIFGMSKGTKITTQQKSTVGNLLYNVIAARIKEEYNNLETHNLVLHNLQNQKTTLEGTKEENLLLKENYKKSLQHFMNSLVTQINKEMAISIALSEDAKDFIISKITDLETIEKAIRGAVHMALNLTINYSSTLLIEPEHISIEERKHIDIAVYKNDKYSNIIELLDKYEVAASKAHQREWKINGNTVSELCEPKITPSAITFNLKKYKKPINTLLERYDDKWPLLKTYFKPLKNIIEKGGDSFLNAQSA